MPAIFYSLEDEHAWFYSHEAYYLLFQSLYKYSGFHKCYTYSKAEYNCDYRHFRGNALALLLLREKSNKRMV